MKHHSKRKFHKVKTVILCSHTSMYCAKTSGRMPLLSQDIIGMCVRCIHLQMNLIQDNIFILTHTYTLPLTPTPTPTHPYPPLHTHSDAMPFATQTQPDKCILNTLYPTQCVPDYLLSQQRGLMFCFKLLEYVEWYIKSKINGSNNTDHVSITPPLVIA